MQVFTLVCMAVLLGIIVMQSRNTPVSFPDGLADEQVSFLLSELEDAAPALFQLRKVGYVPPTLSLKIRQQLLEVDADRAKKVFALLDGTVDLTTKESPNVR